MIFRWGSIKTEGSGKKDIVKWNGHLMIFRWGTIKTETSGNKHIIKWKSQVLGFARLPLTVWLGGINWKLHASTCSRDHSWTPWLENVLKCCPQTHLGILTTTWLLRTSCPLVLPRFPGVWHLQPYVLQREFKTCFIYFLAGASDCNWDRKKEKQQSLRFSSDFEATFFTTVPTKPLISPCVTARITSPSIGPVLKLVVQTVNETKGRKKARRTQGNKREIKN